MSMMWQEHSDPCTSNIISSSWEEWISEYGKGNIYESVNQYCQYVRPLLIKKEATCCIRFLERLEQEQNMTYADVVNRLSFSKDNYKHEEYDIVCIATKIKKDVNCFMSGQGTCRDMTTGYLEGLRDFIRSNIPSFENLGTQKDRARISGIIYQLTVECSDPKMADLCFLYSLIRYDVENPIKGLIGHVVGYLFSSYRMIQLKNITFGGLLNLTPVHVAVMREDYAALASLPYRSEDFWIQAGLSEALPMDLAYFNACVSPSKSSVLTLLLVCLGAKNLQPSGWDSEVLERVNVMKTVVQELLETRLLKKYPEYTTRGETFFGTWMNGDSPWVFDDMQPVDCSSFIPTDIDYKNNALLFQHVSLIFASEERYKTMALIEPLLSYEGAMAIVRKSLGPVHKHLSPKLPNIFAPNELVAVLDERFLLLCGVFTGVFAVLAYKAAQYFEAPLRPPHVMFHITDIYTLMTVCKYIDDANSMQSFYRQCLDAKKQLSGNGIRYCKKALTE